MTEFVDMHVYDRPAIAGADDAPGRILARITPGSRVLDVGTGSGALARVLGGEKGCVVDGLTCNAAERERAAAHYRRILLVDLETQLPSAVFAGEVYDFIVCADVLEHLRNADAVLADLAGLLAPEGRILVSVPNVTYMGVIASLLGGHLSRTREGLLDVTHVRFFDRAGLDALAAAAGLQLAALERVVRNLAETEFRYLDFAAFPPSVAGYLQSLPESLTYEYVAEMLPAGNGMERESKSVALPAFAEVDPVPHFEAQVYLDGGSGFSEQDSVRAYGQLGVDARAELRFPLPAALSGRLQGVMIDFADRPGTFELFSVRVENGLGEVLWQWMGDWSSQLLFRDLESLPAQGAQQGRLMRSLGRQPRMQTEFSPALTGAAVLMVDMTAPQRYEALAFERAQRVASSAAQLMQTSVATLAGELEARHNEILALHQRLSALSEENISLHKLLQCAAVDKQSMTEESLSLHKLLQCASDEKSALIQARQAAEQLQQQQQEQLAMLQSRIATPFRLAAARVRWLVRRLLRVGES